MKYIHCIYLLGVLFVNRQEEKISVNKMKFMMNYNETCTFIDTKYIRDVFIYIHTNVEIQYPKKLMFDIKKCQVMRKLTIL